MYHSIADNPDDLYSVTVETFREQLSWLSDHGFEIVTLSFLLQALRARSHGDLLKKVVLTFDDGYQDFFTDALPVLSDRGAPATVFLVTDMLGGRALWNGAAARGRLMTEDEVRAIKARGMSLGSHTATHANLPLLDEAEMLRELTDSCDRLGFLGESFRVFSYPWGQWSPRVVETVKAAGYECALAVGGWMRTASANTYLLPRVTMTREMGLKDFRSRLMRRPIETGARRLCRALLDKVSRVASASEG